MASRWAWMLLASYAALIALVFTGIALAYLDFNNEPLEPLPDPPENKTRTVTSSSYYRDDRVEKTEEYNSYIQRTERYADYSNDPRIYVLIPSFVAAIIAIVMLLVGICSRQIFSTTVSLYSSFGTFVLAIVCFSLYQSKFAWLPDEAIQTYFMNSYISVTSYLTAMIGCVALQIILAGKELRAQKTGWPTVNFSNIFTVNTVLLTGILTAAGFTVTSYGMYSALCNGLTLISDDWDDPKTKFPIYYALPCITANAFGFVVNAEALLSHLFGHSHFKLTGIFGLFSAFGYGTVAIFFSPGFVRFAIGPYECYPETMTCAIITTVLSLLYTFACFLSPRFLATPPVVVQVFAKTAPGLASEVTSASDEVNNDAVTPATDKVHKNAEPFMKRIQGLKYPLYSMAVVVLSFVCIILNATSVNSPWGSSWTTHVMIAANVAVINRILPKVVVEVSSGVPTTEPGLQILINFLIETVLLISSVLGSFCEGFSLECGAAALNIPVIIYEFISMRANPSIKAGMTALAATRPDDESDTQPLKQNEEVPSATQDEECVNVPEPLV